jgi:hypothetical protein
MDMQMVSKFNKPAKFITLGLLLVFVGVGFSLMFISLLLKTDVKNTMEGYKIFLEGIFPFIGIVMGGISAGSVVVKVGEAIKTIKEVSNDKDN